jgi:two-component system chemotaxis response regulator CheB
MPDHDIIVIGGSAGALEPLMTVLKGLPAGLPASVFVVIHTSPQSAGALPGILERGAALPVSFPGDEEEIRTGHVYVAPPDHHLLVRSGVVSVWRGPRENGFWPAIDPLFRSASQIYKSRVVGVILSRGSGLAGAALYAHHSALQERR